MCCFVAVANIQGYTWDIFLFFILFIWKIIISITLIFLQLVFEEYGQKDYTNNSKSNIIKIFLCKSWEMKLSTHYRLWRLYNNLETNSPLRYHVYYHVIELAARVGAVGDVFKGVEQLTREFVSCPPSNEQMQKLYRLLHQVLKDQNTYAYYSHSIFTFLVSSNGISVSKLFLRYFI